MSITHLPLTAMTLALACLIVAPAHGSPLTTEASQQADSAGEWPAAIRRFWEERSSETVSINGVMWSVRVKQAGERQAAIAARGVATSARPSPAELAEAYKADDAPLYIRLTDGAIAQTPEAAAGMEDGVAIILGKPGRVLPDVVELTFEGEKHTIRMDERIQQMLIKDQLTEATLVIRLLEVRHDQRSTSDGKSLIRTYSFRPLEVKQPTPEELRKWCRQNNVTAFPDPRPIPQAVDTPREIPPSPRTDGKVKTVLDRPYTFTWSNHAMPVSAAAK